MEFLLNDRQKDDLQKAILEYFMNSDGFENTIEALKGDCGLQTHENSRKALLEKKWVCFYFKICCFELVLK